ncbi:MAG: alpha/beta hydrolase [Proteobacteria bacterium]|nr:alpha/beta hydrolase [Pseudomonadota bacterium]MBU1451847.1 alpha/beta hydrolase [Pseudomonadota bacterium]MBU2469042.1 alpha/beta hydrolase [Pseudomonadota bacterium]MBU2517871.1 alpha/beta hydrolase [Pseudomonadota bacterium]
MWQKYLDGREMGFYQGRSGFDPARPSLLLIHGAGGRGEAFLPQLSNLKQINVAALDLPGHFATPGPGRRRVEDYAEWVAEFLAAGPLRPVVLGHSLGGAIVQELALSHPELVRGVILMSTGARLPVNPALLAGIKENFLPTVETIVGWAYSRGVDKLLLRQGVEQMAQTDPQVLHDDFYACNQFDAGERLSRLRLPTLIVVGAEDKMTPPALSQAMAQAIPEAELRIIQGGGHMIQLEQHREVNQAIADFMGRF